MQSDILLSKEEKSNILEGIKNKQLIDKTLAGDASIDHQKIISVVSDLNLNNRIIKEIFNDEEIEHIYNFNKMTISDKTSFFNHLQNNPGDTSYTTTVVAVTAAAVVAVAAAKVMKSIKGDYCMPRDISHPRDIRPPPRRGLDGGNIPVPRPPRTAP